MARSQVQPELASGINSIPFAGIMLIQQPGRLTVVTFDFWPLARSHMVAVPARKNTVWAEAENRRVWAGYAFEIHFPRCLQCLKFGDIGEIILLRESPRILIFPARWHRSNRQNVSESRLPGGGI